MTENEPTETVLDRQDQDQEARRKTGFPPGPRWPRAIQTVWWASRPESLLDRCRRRYGDVFRLRPYGHGDIVCIADPELIKTVFTGDRDVFHAGAANATMEPVLGRHSVLLLDGERHLHERRLMLPPFHGDAIQRYQQRVRNIAEAEIDLWPVGKTFPLRPRMQAITLEVILQAVMGISDPVRLERLRTLLPQLLDFSVLDMWTVWLAPWVLNTPLGSRHKSMRIRPEVDQLLLEEIDTHRENPKGRDDILALLVEARDEHGEALSDEELRDQLITLLLAGHETTATGLAWAFERLLRHPHVLERLRQELDAGDDSYLDAVVKETLRVRPVIESVWRKLTGPVDLAGYRLPAGARVMPAISLVQRSGAYTDPEEFRPERFLEGSPPPYTFIPFGGGPRRCIGASFALMEMHTVIRTVLDRVELRAPRSRPEGTRVHHVTMVPAAGARVVISKHLPGTG